ncbi:MAG: hypothetical protein H6713_16250 [Myxococcales bacterium]|nr:hypothetical protein [Myxococcales bacterium]
MSVDAPEAAPGLASRLEEAVRSRGAVAGLSTRMSLAPGALARALAGPVLRDASVTIPGGESVTPTRRAQLHAGVELIALATVPPGAPITLELRDDARGRAVTIPVPSRATSGPLFDYLWTAHGVDARLSEGGLSPETEAELRALSLERHVLTPQTALIALESHWEEYDNGVRDRHARAQLVVEDGAVALRERVTRALPDAHEPPGARDLTELVDERIDSTDKRRRHQVFADMYARWRELETLHAMAHRLRLAELESAALGETAEQRHQRIEYGLGEFVYSHASPRALERLVDSLRDPSLSLAAKVCRARELAGLADAEDLTWTNVELAADPPARPERLWPQSPAMAAQLADAWSAHGEPLQARRAAGSLEELGSSRLAHAAVLETISGAGAEARARLLELRAELEAEAAALPEAERPFTDAWARQLVYPDALSPRGRRAHQGALAIAYLLAVSWLREGDPQRAASSLEDWLPRVGEALADNERALFDQRSGLPPLRSLALVARRFADGGERPPTLVIGAYSPAALDLDADAISPRGVTIATSLLERGPLLSWSRWPAAVVVHHPTRARPPRSEAGDRWARVDALYSVDGGPLTVESRLVRVDHETLASVVMPEAVLRRADCDATPAANNMSE